MTSTRSRLAVLSVAAAMLVPAGAPTAAAASLPRIQLVEPGYGEVVTTDTVDVEVVGVAESGIDRWELRLEEVPLSDVVGTLADDGTRVVVSAAVELAPGVNHLSLQIWDTAGYSRTRGWQVVRSELAARRLGDRDRILTAVRISQDRFDDGAATGAVLARADEYPDALTGAPVARAVGGPLLLTRPDDLPDEVAEELRRAVTPGARLYVLGGGAAIRSGVDDELRDLGFTVERVYGSNRLETAVAVAALLPDATSAVLASGETFADALSVGVPAARDGMPILLTASGELDGSVRRHLVGRGYEHVIVVGGEAAVSEAVLEDVAALGPTVERVAGIDRYATAVAVADRFFPEVQTVTLTSGAYFADGLAGSVHAAGMGAPLLLVQPDAAPTLVQRRIAQWRPEGIIVYGGSAAVDGHVVDQLRGSHAGGDGPLPIGTVPGRSADVGFLDDVVVTLDRPVDPDRSRLSVFLDGIEIPGRTTVGADGTEVRFNVEQLPFAPTLDERLPVRVTGAIHDAAGSTFLEERFTLTRRSLVGGDEGTDVRLLQERLVALGYWIDRVDGRYGYLTSQAVMAFEKVHGLPRDGVADAEVRRLLEVAGRPVPRSRSGHVVEVDKGRQVWMFVSDGQVLWTLNTSTGTERPYEYEGKTYLAHTPTGSFQVTRQIDGLRVSHLGELWRPKYFVGGIAFHGSNSVPAYPASHGCVRLSNQAMDWIWEIGLVPIGTPVVVYE